MGSLSKVESMLLGARTALSVIASLGLSIGLLAVPTAASANEGSGSRETSAVDQVLEPDALVRSTPPLPDIVRGWATLAPGRPVAAARVRLLDPSGRVLARTRTAPNGQFLLQPEQPVVEGSTVVVRGGTTQGFPGVRVWLKAPIDPSDNGVIDVNLLTTLFAACVVQPDAEKCGTGLTEHLQLPPGVDHAQVMRDLGLYLDVDTVLERARSRDVTTWKASRELVAAGFNAGESLRVTSVGAAEARERTVSTAEIGSDLASAVIGGVLSRISGNLADKLLVSWGLKSPESVPGMTAADVTALKAQLQGIETSLQTVISNQQVELSELSKISQGISAVQYTTLRTGFAAQSQELAAIAEYLHFLLEFGDCASGNPTTSECASLPADPEPASGVGITACHEPPAGASTWISGVYVQCAYLMNNIAAYASKYQVDSAASALAGSGAGTAGLIQWGQVAYLDHVLNSVLTSANQGLVRAVGSYWLNQWEYDVLAWALAGQQPSLLPNTVAPSVAKAAASQHANQITTAAADTSGQYFGREIVTGCPVVYDHGNAKLYGLRTNIYSVGYRVIVPGSTGSTTPSTSQPDCDVVGLAGSPWVGGWSQDTSLSGNARASTITGFLARISPIAVDATRCSPILLYGMARPALEVCQKMNLDQGGVLEGGACLSAPNDVQRRTGALPIFQQVPNRVYNSRPPWSAGSLSVTSCADLQAAHLPAPFSQRVIYCTPSENYLECLRRPYQVFGPISPRLPSPFNSGPGLGGQNLLQQLPLNSPYKGDSITSYVFGQRGLLSGERYLPVT